MSEIPPLTSEVATRILNKILDELRTVENIKKIDVARDNVGNEMLKILQFIFPIIVEVQMEVIKDFGYPSGRDGIIKFAQGLRELEREDIEIARLHNLVKSYYLPPVSVNASSEEEKAANN